MKTHAGRPPPGLRDPLLGHLPRRGKIETLPDKVSEVVQQILPPQETLPPVTEVLPTEIVPPALEPSVEEITTSVGSGWGLSSLLSRGKSFIQSKPFLYFLAIAATVAAVVGLYFWYTRKTEEIPLLETKEVTSPPETRPPGFYLKSHHADLKEENFVFSYLPAFEPPQEEMNGKEVSIEFSLVDKDRVALQTFTICGCIEESGEISLQIDPEIDLEKVHKVVVEKIELVEEINPFQENELDFLDILL